jgi:hypothetical protein
MIDPDGTPRPDASLGLIDRLTKTAASTMSRRLLFKGALIGGLSVAAGVPLLNPITAGATNCNDTWAPCGYCESQTGLLCSPNGVYCFYGTCTCNSNCSCCCFHAHLTVCDDGGNSVSCPTCCVACFPCC